MKKVNLLFMILGLLILSNIAFGQEDGAIPLEEAQRLGRLPRDFQIDRFRRVPEGCPRGAKPYVISRNAQTGVSRSVTMQNFFNISPTRQQFPERGYGEKGPDRWFGDSFPLGGCKICGATLSVSVVNEGGLSTNDSLVAYLTSSTIQLDRATNGSPKTNPTSSPFLYVYSTGVVTPGIGLWSPPLPSPKTLSFDLRRSGNLSDTITTDPDGVVQINNHIFNSGQNPMLEVFVQDDTLVNSVQLVVWR